MLNQVERQYGIAIYFMPESMVEICFEIFRIIKRDEIPVYDNEEEKSLYKDDFLKIYGKRFKETSFPYELCLFISKHL